MAPLSGWIDRFRSGRRGADADAGHASGEAARAEPERAAGTPGNAASTHAPEPSAVSPPARSAPRDVPADLVFTESTPVAAPRTADAFETPQASSPADAPSALNEDGAAENSPFSLLHEQSAPSEDASAVDVTALQEKVIATLREIYDPEIPVNIYDLGLIYRVDVSEHGAVDIDMTLTTPGCPVAATFPGTVESMVENIPEVVGARVELVWDPPWTMDRMPDEVKLELGLL